MDRKRGKEHEEREGGREGGTGEMGEGHKRRWRRTHNRQEEQTATVLLDEEK